MRGLDSVAALAKSADTRHQVFDDPTVLRWIMHMVKDAMESPTATPSEDMTGLSDPTFHSPARCSPEAAGELARAFGLLRDSCAGCRGNQDVLRGTELSHLALKFAVDQASFACGASHPTGVGGTSSVRSADSTDPGAEAPTTASSTSTPAEESARATKIGAQLPAATALARQEAGALATEGDDAGIRLGVRTALQFACNYCVGNKENQAQLWDMWFARGFMELVNGLKTDRRLLSLSVALIHNCCLACGEAGGGGETKGQQGRVALARERGAGRERLGRLTADKAFCCLLMKVVPQNQTGTHFHPPTTTKPTRNSSNCGDDPAAEWLYLLFCRFVQEGLLYDVYANVGIRAGGRPPTFRPKDTEETAHDGFAIGAQAQRPSGEMGGAAGARQEREHSSQSVAPVADARIAPGVEGRAEGDVEFFFPVTPEQLIVLNLGEIAAGDEVVTGGEHPTPAQRQNCQALLRWLFDLLSAMPINQSLCVRATMPPPPPPPPLVATVAKPPSSETPVSVSGKAAARTEASSAGVADREGHGGRGDGDDGGGGGGGGGGETELTRRYMREEARSALLRSLAALLAGCNDQTRCTAAAMSSSLRHDVAAAGQAQAISNEGGFATRPATAVCDGVGIDPTGCDTESPPETETRLVPLCLRLLARCGGAAEPAADVSRGAVGAAAAPGVRAEDEGGVPLESGVGRAGVPAGRKAELLKVLGNACFRCRKSQDSVREFGGLPLVLNHCAVDGANPLLREYALLAVRNLCEGNPTNQASIAALQPQGCTPGMDEAMADMGLEGHVDSQGKLRVGPRLPGDNPHRM